MGEADEGVLFFEDPASLRAWFAEHHDSSVEQWVGFYKKKSGVASITWSESVDEALCVGWIDGLRKSIDERRYKIRFTPRTAKSTWSKVNIDKMAALEAEGRIQPTGRAAFAKMEANNSKLYAYEQETPAEFTDELAAALASNEAAQTGWDSRPPGYRRQARHWVMSAKRQATRDKRMATLIECSAAGENIPMLRPWKAKKKPTAGG